MRILMLLILGILISTPLVAGTALAGPKVVINKPPAAQCNLLIDTLKEQLEVGNHCRDDAECVSISLGCPLPCQAPLSRTENLSRIAGLKANYDRFCEPCTYKCKEPGDLACVEGKCVFR